jgi:hypothetical protein
MEGWFWRLTDTRARRVIVALCGVNRHADGPWTTVAVAAHPGGIVRSAAVEAGWASSERFEVRADACLVADERRLRVDVDDVHLSVDLHGLMPWPLRFGAGGLLSAVPFLGQYWHPHVLGGRADGTLRIGEQRWSLENTDVYAEKNWGAGFPDRWWWGQAQGFADREVCVAFGGGRLRVGPLAASVTGCVVRIGSRVVRFAPPTAVVRAEVEGDSWHVNARRRGWRVVLDGQGAGAPPAVLPVPLPTERRNVDRDFEHLAARLRLRIWHDGALLLDDTSSLAALEVGTTDLEAARTLAAGLGLPPTRVT